jgi:hypothetical protein
MKANCGQCAAHQGLIRRPTSGIGLERARRRTADLVRLFLEFLARPALLCTITLALDSTSAGLASLSLQELTWLCFMMTVGGSNSDTLCFRKFHKLDDAAVG